MMQSHFVRILVVLHGLAESCLRIPLRHLPHQDVLAVDFAGVVSDRSCLGPSLLEPNVPRLSIRVRPRSV